MIVVGMLVVDGMIVVGTIVDCFVVIVLEDVFSHSEVDGCFVLVVIFGVVNDVVAFIVVFVIIFVGK